MGRSGGGIGVGDEDRHLVAGMIVWRFLVPVSFFGGKKWERERERGGFCGVGVVYRVYACSVDTSWRDTYLTCR